MELPHEHIEPEEPGRFQICLKNGLSPSEPEVRIRLENYLNDNDDSIPLLDRICQLIDVLGTTRLPLRLTDDDREEISVALKCAASARNFTVPCDRWGLVLTQVLRETHEIGERLASQRSYRSSCRRAATALLQVGERTARAISLLNGEGFVRDARARWRALYELVCSASILANPRYRHLSEALSVLYLAHIGALMPGEPEYRAFVDDKIIQNHYEWMRPLYPPGSDLKVRRLQQRDLFKQADLLPWPFERYVQQCHHDVHVIGPSVMIDGGERFDSFHEQDASLTAWTIAALYELSAATVLLAMVDIHEPLVDALSVKAVNLMGTQARFMLANELARSGEPEDAGC